MIRSYGIPGESQETRTELAQAAPYVLMSSDRPEPHYICEVVDGVGIWIEPPLPVPESCTNRQGKLSLIELGKYQSALNLLETIDDPVLKMKADVEWGAHIWERNSAFLQDVWEQLGGTPSELDDAFRLAITL